MGTGCAGGDLSGILSTYTVGYEVVGEVVEAGSDVTKFRIGKIVRVGCVLGCCRNCRPCNTDTERYRRKKIWSYNDGYPDGQPTQGGFSGSMVVDQEFVVKIPDGMAPKQVAPHLCAVGTVYNRLNHFGLMANGLRVGILGLGGGKHMRVKIAKALEHHVTDIICSSDKKKVEALEHLAADEYLAISGTERMQKAADSLDYIIETVPVFHPFEPYLSLLNLNGKLILTGVISTPLQFLTPLVKLERKPITGKFIGSVNETDEVLQFCRDKDLTSMNEVVKINYVNTAMERPEKSDVPYRVSQEGNVVSLGRKMMEKTRGYTSSFILYFDKSRTHGFAQDVSNTNPITMLDENKGWVSQEGKLVSIGRKMKEKTRGYLSSLILYFDKSRTHEFAQEASITKPVTKQDENKGWFKVFLMLFLLCTTGPSGVRSEDIGNPLIPGSTAMDFLLANKNLRGPSVRRQMRGTEAAAVNDNFNYPSFPHWNSPPNSPARNEANPYKRPCNPGDKCRQGKKGKRK